MNNLKLHKPGIFIIILGLVFFIFAGLVGGIMPYFILYIFLMGFFIPLIHILIISKKLYGSIKINKAQLFVGDNINIEYYIENQSLFTIPYLEIENNIIEYLIGKKSDKLSFYLGKQDFFINKENISLHRRGHYELVNLQIRIPDIFGFYSLEKTLSSNISLLVYPRPIEISEFKMATGQELGQSLLKNFIHKDMSSINSLRNYKEGDSLKSIHWKLSAKKDSLIIKEEDSTIGSNVVIFIDNYISSFKNDINNRLEDKSVDISLSIINYCLKHNIKITLETQNQKGPIQIQGKEEFDLKAFLDIFAKFKAKGSFNLKSLITEKLQSIPKESMVIIITPNFNDEIAALGIDLKTKNLTPIFFRITDIYNNNEPVNLEINNILALEGISSYVLDYNDIIREVLEGQHE